MDTNICDRCGKCCCEFNAKGYQIHFRPDDSFFQLTPEQQIQLNPPLVSIYLRVKSHFIEKQHTIPRYLIPTIQQIQPYLTDIEKNQIPLTNENQHDCLFLQRNKDGTTQCVIHQYNPSMCHKYPENKGGACLNHYERRFTKKFLEFQRTQIGFAIKILRELHDGKITDPIAWELVTFLMDFGQFPLNKVRNFFVVLFHIDSQQFDHLVHLLAEFTLVRVVENKYIEGISLKEVESVVDKIMEDRGWTK